MFTRSEFVAAGQPAPRFSISQIRPFPQCVPPTTVEIYHLRNHGYSNYKRVVREIRTLRAMWRALETRPRQFLNGQEEGKTSDTSQGGAYGPSRQGSTLPGQLWVSCC